MSGKNDTTTKFKVDISDLKKNISEASRQIKLARAEFNAAASGMDNWQKSTDGISAKITQLQSTLKSQNTIMDSYQKQLEETVAEYGENSKGADELRIKIANQQAAINKTTKEIRDYQTQLANLEKEEMEAAQTANTQESAYDSLQKEISEQKTTLSALKSEYASVVLEQGKNSDSAQNLARQIEELSGDLSENKNKLNEAESAADEFDRSLDEVADSAVETSNGGISAFSVALGNLAANAISAVIEKMKELIKETIQVGMNFDSSMSQVAAVSGATADEVQLLRDKAKEMGSTTKFTASEAADAFNYMAMAGWKTEDMLDGIEGIMNLAAASGEDLATTSDIVTDALTAFGHSAEDAGQLADIMAAASSNANTNVKLMGETFKYVAPVAGALGYSMEDTAVAIGLMANAGVKGSQAGTALRSSMARLTKPTDDMIGTMIQLGLAAETTTYAIDSDKLEKAQQKVESKTLAMEKAQISYNEAVAKYGAGSSQSEKAALTLTQAENRLAEAQRELQKEQEGTVESTELTTNILTDSEGNMRSLDDVMGILRESVRGLSQDEQAAAASSLFGKEAMSGMLAVINASDEDFNKLTDAVNNSGGAAEKMSEVMLDNLGGDMTLLKSKVEGLQIALYEQFEPALRSGVDALSSMADGVSWLIENFVELLPVITGVTTALTTFLVIINWGAIMSTAAKALGAVKTAILGVNAAIAANPIGLLISLLAGLVVAFITLWNTSDEFRSFWINLWEKIKKVVKPVIENIVKWFSTAWDSIKKVWSVVSEFFTALFNAIWQSVEPIIDAMVGAFTEAWELIKVVWDYASIFFEMVWNRIKIIFSVVEVVLKGFFEAAWIAIKAVWDVVVLYYQHLWDRIKAIFSVVKAVLAGYFKVAWEAIKLYWNEVTGYFKAIWETIKGIFSVVKNVLTGNWREAWEGIKGIVNTWVSYFTGIWEGIKGIFGSVGSWFEDIFSTAWEAVKSIFNGWGEFFSGLWETIKSTFSELGTSIANAIGASITAGINGILAMIENTINSAIKMINKALKAINKLPGVSVGKLDEVELPRLQSGGVLKRGQVGLLEGNGAEAVVPLENNKKWISKTAKDLKQSMINEGMLTGGSSEKVVNNNYTFNQTNNSPKALSRLEIYRQTKNQLAFAKGV